MRAYEVDEVALDAGQLRDRLGRHRATGYVAVDPGPEQQVQKMEEFRASLSA
jgi:hypothetical protein